MLDAGPEQLVPGRVELDFPEILTGDCGRVRVREPPELERLAAAPPSERGAVQLVRRSAFTPKRFDERPVLREDVVTRQRRRLVRRTEVGRRRQLSASIGGAKIARDPGMS